MTNHDKPLYLFRQGTRVLAYCGGWYNGHGLTQMGFSNLGPIEFDQFQYWIIFLGAQSIVIYNMSKNYPHGYGSWLLLSSYF